MCKFKNNIMIRIIWITIVLLFLVLIYPFYCYTAEYNYDDDNDLIMLDNELYKIDSNGNLYKVADSGSNSQISITSSAAYFAIVKEGARIVPVIWNYLWRNLSKFDFFRKIRKFIFPRTISNYEKSMIKSSQLKKTYGKRVGRRDKIIDKHKQCGNITSCESMRIVNAPFDNKCNPIQLHHVAQEEDGIILELTSDEHSKNYSILHNHSKVSEIDRYKFEKWKKDYWKLRAIGICN